jgi:hypothetical protein
MAAHLIGATRILATWQRSPHGFVISETLCTSSLWTSLSALKIWSMAFGKTTDHSCRSSSESATKGKNFWHLILSATTRTYSICQIFQSVMGSHWMSITCRIVWRPPHCMCFHAKSPHPLTTASGERQFLGYALGQPHSQQASVQLSVFRISTASGSAMRRQTLFTWWVTNLLLRALTPITGGVGAVPGTAANMIGCRRRTAHTLAHTLPALPCAEKGWLCCTRWWHSLSPLLSSPHFLTACGLTAMTASGLISLWTATKNGLVRVQRTVTCALPMTARTWPKNPSFSALRELPSTAVIQSSGLGYPLQSAPIQQAISGVNSWGRSLLF